MKTLIPLLAALVLCGCESKRPAPGTVQQATFTNAQEVTQKRLPTLSEDFVMGSQTAVSNAVLFGKPPDGFTVVCAPDGTFAPAFEGRVIDTALSIRTSKWEAVVASWRVKEIWESPRTPPQIGAQKAWEKCE